MTETESLLVLNAVSGVTNIQIRKLLQHYGSAEKICSLKRAEFQRDQIILPKFIQNILDFPREEFLEDEYRRIDAEKIKVVTIEDELYPALLKEIPDYPVVLYVKGDLPGDLGLSIAIVGSRKTTLYGKMMSNQFALRLSELGFTIISGMARGIDTWAHQGALKVKGSTVAVLGCGLSQVYPPENENLMREITEQGAVLSEFPMTTPPYAYNFPRRNRIISGLSLGVIVVEAAARSGALITAHSALEQGREVFAVPGKIDNPFAGGVNNLIRQGAKIITCVEDVLEEIHPQLTSFVRGENQLHEEKAHREVGVEKLTNKEKLLYDQLSEKPLHIDTLAKEGDCDVSMAMSSLLQLEMKRMVKQLPGKMFVK